MCIVLAKKMGTKIPKDLYRNCAQNNSDGAGFAYIKDGKLYTAKGFFTFEDFWDNFEPLEESSPLIHFRIGTSGGNNADNCHPWRVNDNLVFAHNGVISITRNNQNLSDTGNFNESILKPLAGKCPDFWKRDEFKWIIENAIGTNNKLVLVDNTGETRIFNEKQGVWKDGVWFSNHTFSYSKSYSNYAGCNNYNCNDTYYKNKLNSDKVIELNDFSQNELDIMDEKLERAEQARLASLYKK